MDILALLTGNRVNYGINTFGGVRRDITPEQSKEVLAAMDKLQERTEYYIRLATEEVTIIKRLSGVGLLSYEDALRLGAVGPTARASGVKRDTRKDDPYLVYDQLSFEVITHETCDVYGRAIVRLKELLESYRIIRQCLKNLPAGPILIKAPRKIPAGEATIRYEAPRGEDMHYVKSNGSEKPERVKVRAPTLANIQAVKHMLRNRFLADMPIVVAAIDPCFSCTDRMVALQKIDSKKTKVMTWEELHNYSILWHKKRGADFSSLNAKTEKEFTN
jgi:NADH-quinone oxidoreductase subunit D